MLYKVVNVQVIIVMFKILNKLCLKAWTTGSVYWIPLAFLVDLMSSLCLRVYCKIRYPSRQIYFSQLLTGGTRRHRNTLKSSNNPNMVSQGRQEQRHHTTETRQTLTKRTGAFKHRIIREEDETHLQSN